MPAARAGEPVDREAAIEAAGKAATRHVVRQQIAAGIDVGNNGEQQREAFFLYVRHRMSGFGGSWTRRPFADVAHYPAFSAWKAAHDARQPVGQQPRRRARRRSARCAISIRALVEAECDDFRAALNEVGGRLRRTVHDRALARHHRRRDAQRTLRHRGRLSGTRWARRCRSNTRPSSRHGFLLQIDAPDLAMERHITYQDRPLGDFLDFVERVVATINDALVNIPRDRVRLHACWGNYEGPHDCDVALPDILPAISTGEGRRLGAAVRQSAPRARVSLPDGSAAGRRPGGRRRRDRSADQLRRAPRGGGRPARSGGADGRRSAAVCWPAPIAASTPRPGAGASRRTWSGPSWRR